MTRILFSSFLAIILFSSCHYIGGKRVRGNGNIISQNRQTNAFDAIDVGGAIEVYVRQDSGRSVRVETDENLQELVEVYERSGVLHIEPRNNYNLDPSNKRVKVYVSGPRFRSIEVSGASNVYGENRITESDGLSIGLSGASNVKLDAKAPSLDIDMSGASDITLSGETRDLRVQGSGASGAKCFDLKAENVTVDISGASSAEVFASVKLDAEASGASGVKYRGEATVSQHASGASSVKKLD